MHSADGNLGGKVTIWMFCALALSLCGVSVCVCVCVSVFLSFVDVIILYT
jgi:hypothetical protein